MQKETTICRGSLDCVARKAEMSDKEELGKKMKTANSE